jgi:hypothetical protein
MTTTNIRARYEERHRKVANLESSPKPAPRTRSTARRTRFWEALLVAKAAATPTIPVPDDHASGVLATLAWLSENDFRPQRATQQPLGAGREPSPKPGPGSRSEDRRTCFWEVLPEPNHGNTFRKQHPTPHSDCGEQRILGDFATGVLDTMMWAHGKSHLLRRSSPD